MAAAEALREQLAENFCGELVEEVISLFARADVDGSGTISAGEFRPLLSELYLWTSTPVFEDMIEEEASGLMREFDKDKDSALDAREFCTMLKTSRLAKVLKDQWRSPTTPEEQEFSTPQGQPEEFRRKSSEPIYIFENGDRLYDATLAGLDEEQESQVDPLRLLEFPAPLDALGVLKHVELWARGNTDSFVEVKAVVVDSRDKPLSTRLAVGLLYTPQDFYSLADFLKVHDFKEGVLMRNDAKLYACAALASTMRYLNETCSRPYQGTSLDHFTLTKNPEGWHFGYRLRLRCAFSTDDYQRGKVMPGPLGVEENLKLLADLIWLIHHFSTEDEDSACTVATYTSKRFLAKEINGEKVPLRATRQILEELWTQSEGKVNMDHITKKLQTQALELAEGCKPFLLRVCQFFPKPKVADSDGSFTPASTEEASERSHEIAMCP
ncbi:unnamed protein product [Symbiodinium natans]|uniref:EF-hand domain-containing protein n=1 Tax=Symbiodinium natans TaxID=878477 RepID=A0A812R2P4_9DINO|nr:unnamed protein product [Symbiodinium natans]